MPPTPGTGRLTRSSARAQAGLPPLTPVRQYEAAPVKTTPKRTRTRKKTPDTGQIKLTIQGDRNTLPFDLSSLFTGGRKHNRKRKHSGGFSSLKKLSKSEIMYRHIYSDDSDSEDSADSQVQGKAKQNIDRLIRNNCVKELQELVAQLCRSPSEVDPLAREILVEKLARVATPKHVANAKFPHMVSPGKQFTVLSGVTPTSSKPINQINNRTVVSNPGEGKCVSVRSSTAGRKMVYSSVSPFKNNGAAAQNGDNLNAESLGAWSNGLTDENFLLAVEDVEQGLGLEKIVDVIGFSKPSSFPTVPSRMPQQGDQEQVEGHSDNESSVIRESQSDLETDCAIPSTDWHNVPRVVTTSIGEACSESTPNSPFKSSCHSAIKNIPGTEQVRVRSKVLSPGRNVKLKTTLLQRLMGSRTGVEEKQLDSEINQRQSQSNGLPSSAIESGVVEDSTSSIISPIKPSCETTTGKVIIKTNMGDIRKYLCRKPVVNQEAVSSEKNKFALDNSNSEGNTSVVCREASMNTDEDNHEETETLKVSNDEKSVECNLVENSKTEFNSDSLLKDKQSFSKKAGGKQTDTNTLEISENDASLVQCDLIDSSESEVDLRTTTAKNKAPLRKIEKNYRRIGQSKSEDSKSFQKKNETGHKEAEATEEKETSAQGDLSESSDSDVDLQTRLANLQRGKSKVRHLRRVSNRFKGIQQSKNDDKQLFVKKDETKVNDAKSVEALENETPDLIDSSGSEVDIRTSPVKNKARRTRKIEINQSKNDDKRLFVKKSGLERKEANAPEVSEDETSVQCDVVDCSNSDVDLRRSPDKTKASHLRKVEENLKTLNKPKNNEKKLSVKMNESERKGANVVEVSKSKTSGQCDVVDSSDSEVDLRRSPDKTTASHLRKNEENLKTLNKSKNNEKKLSVKTNESERKEANVVEVSNSKTSGQCDVVDSSDSEIDLRRSPDKTKALNLRRVEENLKTLNKSKNNDKNLFVKTNESERERAKIVEVLKSKTSGQCDLIDSSDSDVDLQTRLANVEIVKNKTSDLGLKRVEKNCTEIRQSKNSGKKSFVKKNEVEREAVKEIRPSLQCDLIDSDPQSEAILNGEITNSSIAERKAEYDVINESNCVENGTEECGREMANSKIIEVKVISSKKSRKDRIRSKVIPTSSDIVLKEANTNLNLRLDVVKEKENSNVDKSKVMSEALGHCTNIVESFHYATSSVNDLPAEANVHETNAFSCTNTNESMRDRRKSLHRTGTAGKSYDTSQNVNVNKRVLAGTEPINSANESDANDESLCVITRLKAAIEEDNVSFEAELCSPEKSPSKNKKIRKCTSNADHYVAQTSPQSNGDFAESTANLSLPGRDGINNVTTTSLHLERNSHDNPSSENLNIDDNAENFSENKYEPSLHLDSDDSDAQKFDVLDSSQFTLTHEGKALNIKNNDISATSHSSDNSEVESEDEFDKKSKKKKINTSPLSENIKKKKETSRRTEVTCNSKEVSVHEKKSEEDMGSSSESDKEEIIEISQSSKIDEGESSDSSCWEFGEQGSPLNQNTKILPEKSCQFEIFKSDISNPQLTSNQAQTDSEESDEELLSFDKFQRATKQLKSAEVKKTKEAALSNDNNGNFIASQNPEEKTVDVSTCSKKSVSNKPHGKRVKIMCKGRNATMSPVSVDLSTDESEEEHETESVLQTVHSLARNENLNSSQTPYHESMEDLPEMELSEPTESSGSEPGDDEDRLVIDLDVTSDFERFSEVKETRQRHGNMNEIEYLSICSTEASNIQETVDKENFDASQLTIQSSQESYLKISTSQPIVSLTQQAIASRMITDNSLSHKKKSSKYENISVIDSSDSGIKEGSLSSRGLRRNNEVKIIAEEGLDLLTIQRDALIKKFLESSRKMEKRRKPFRRNYLEESTETDTQSLRDSDGSTFIENYIKKKKKKKKRKNKDIEQSNEENVSAESVDSQSIQSKLIEKEAGSEMENLNMSVATHSKKKKGKKVEEMTDGTFVEEAADSLSASKKKKKKRQVDDAVLEGETSTIVDSSTQFENSFVSDTSKETEVVEKEGSAGKKKKRKSKEIDEIPIESSDAPNESSKKRKSKKSSELDINEADVSVDLDDSIASEKVKKSKKKKKLFGENPDNDSGEQIDQGAIEEGALLESGDHMKPKKKKKSKMANDECENGVVEIVVKKKRKLSGMENSDEIVSEKRKDKGLKLSQPEREEESSLEKKKKKKRKETAVETIPIENLPYFPQHFLDDLQVTKPQSNLPEVDKLSGESLIKRKKKKKTKDPMETSDFIPLHAEGSTKFGAMLTSNLVMYNQGKFVNFKSEMLFGKHTPRAPSQSIKVIKEKQAADRKAGKKKWTHFF